MTLVVTSSVTSSPSRSLLNGVRYCVDVFTDISMCRSAYLCCCDVTCARMLRSKGQDRSRIQISVVYIVFVSIYVYIYIYTRPCDFVVCEIHELSSNLILLCLFLFFFPCPCTVVVVAFCPLPVTSSFMFPGRLLRCVHNVICVYIIEQESPANAKGTRDSSACMKARCEQM